MHPKTYALVGGALMVLMAALSFLPALNQLPAEAGLPPLYVETSYGLFLNFFPMNIVNKVALLVFGIWGIAAASASTTALPRSINWSRWVFAVMGVGALLGIIPATNTVYGYWPLFGGEVWAHGIFAVLGAYFGFALPARAHKANEPLLRNQDRSRVA